MTVQITDEQLAGLKLARSAIRNAINRNRIRMVDIELLTAGAALDEVLLVSEQNQAPEGISSSGAQL